MKINDPSVRSASNYLMPSTRPAPAEPGSDSTRPQRGDSSADELDISPQGRLAGQLNAMGLLGVQPDAQGNIHIEDIRAALQQRTDGFRGKLSRLLREAGVDRSQEATLKTDAAGKVLVANDHPDKTKIEAIFEQHPELANEFRGISATASFLNAADRAAPFHQAYAKDPYAAVAQYSYLFDDHGGPEFQWRITQDAMEAFFVDR